MRLAAGNGKRGRFLPKHSPLLLISLLEMRMASKLGCPATGPGTLQVYDGQVPNSAIAVDIEAETQDSGVV